MIATTTTILYTQAELKQLDNQYPSVKEGMKGWGGSCTANRAKN